MKEFLNEWVFLDEKSFTVVIGEKKPISLPPHHYGKVETGRVFEMVTTSLDKESLAAFYESENVSIKIGPVSFDLSTIHKDSLREFAKQIPADYAVGKEKAPDKRLEEKR